MAVFDAFSGGGALLHIRMVRSRLPTNVNTRSH